MIDRVERGYGERLTALEGMPVGGSVEMFDDDAKVFVGAAVAAVAASAVFACLSVGAAALAYIARGGRG